MDSSKNKTLPTRERNKENCEIRRWIVVIPIIVDPIVVPVPLVAIEVKITNVEVAIRVAVI